MTDDKLLAGVTYDWQLRFEREGFTFTVDEAETDIDRVVFTWRGHGYRGGPIYVTRYFILHSPEDWQGSVCHHAVVQLQAAFEEP